MTGGQVVIEQCTQHYDRGDRVIFCWTEDYRDGGQVVIEQCMQHYDRGTGLFLVGKRTTMTGGTGCD